MISAPNSPRSVVQKGAATKVARSRTVSPARARGVTGGTGSAAALLLPEPERTDGRLVVELEEAGGPRAGAAPVLDAAPGRRRERVTGLPAHGDLADPALALPLDHVVDG